MSKLREAVIAKPTRPLKLEVKEICDRLDYLFLQTDGGYKLPFDNPALFDVLGMMIGLKAALAEQEEAQEPVAGWLSWHESAPNVMRYTKHEPFNTDGWCKQELYTKPQPLKRLSDDEIVALAGDSMRHGFLRYDEFANAIQDAMQEKNR